METKRNQQDAQTGFRRITAALHHHPTAPIPKGELWLGADILQMAGYEDSLNGRVRLIKHLEQDMLCLPTDMTSYRHKMLGYRYFTVSAVKEALAATDLFVMAVIDGPFQRLVEKEGLMAVFGGWVRDREDVLKAYENERKHVLNLLADCLEYAVHGVVIADDLAGDTATFLDPVEIDKHFSHFYIQAVSEIHSGNAVALFHSCGNISKLIPQLIGHGFDGLAAVQDRANDLLQLKTQYGSRLVLMAGIEGEILAQNELSLSDLEKLKERCHFMARDGGFILSSACGLYAGGFLERIKKIYRSMDSHP
ncbi:conserved hypothetical protein [delta proteobacterium NaphS2]|nr:conserved hypothetical protein [delta proteobacterium NaphS2]